MERPMPQRNDLSRSLLALDQNSTIIAVIEMSQSNWLVAGIIPGVDRQPLKKLEPDEEDLLHLLRRWQDEAARAGRTISRIAVAFEAGRDGFWLARWLRARGIEAYVIHPASIPVSREHRRAKTDRLHTALLKAAFLGWLRGEPNHCSMAAVSTLEQEDAKRPNREREVLVGERTRIVNRMKGTLARLGIRGLPPIIFPGRPEGRRSDEALKAEPDAPQATLEQRHQAAGDVLALRRRGFFRRGVCFPCPPTARSKHPDGRQEEEQGRAGRADRYARSGWPP